MRSDQIDRFVTRLMRHQFTPPRDLPLAAQEERIATVARAVDQAIPLSYTAERAEIALGKAFDSIAFDAKTTAWPTPAEVRRAVQAAAPIDRKPDYGAPKPIGAPPDLANGPIRQDLLDLAQSIADAMRYDQPPPDAAMRYDTAVQIAVRRLGVDPEALALQDWCDKRAVPHRVPASLLPTGACARLKARWDAQHEAAA